MIYTEELVRRNHPGQRLSDHSDPVRFGRQCRPDIWTVDHAARHQRFALPDSRDIADGTFRGNKFFSDLVTQAIKNALGKCLIANITIN